MINQYWSERPVRRTIVAALLAAALTSSHMAFADVTLNFANADIDQIARAIGAATGKTIIVDPRVKGQLSLQSERPVSDEQALKTLQSALRMQGFSLLQDHGVLKVVPEADAKLQGVPTFLGNRPQARGDQVVTQVFQLRNESANNLLPILRPLISPNNTVSAYPANNTLVVTDYADNVRRIASIIAGIDTPAGSAIEVIPLSNASAVDVAASAQKLLDPSAIGSTDATLKVNVSVDTRTNSVILRASNSARMALAKSLIRKLDAPTRQRGNIHVVPLRSADATELAKTLRAMMGSAGNSGSGKASGTDLFSSNSASGGSSSSGGLANSNGSLPPLPSGTGSTSSTSSSGTSSGTGTTGGLLGASSGTGGASGSSAGSGSSDESSSGGMVQADAPTNSLIITAPEPVYQNLRNVIDQLDARRAQVYIESLILEVSSTDTDQFGIQWLTSAGLTAAATTTSGIGIVRTFSSILGSGGLFQALSNKSDVNVLSTPNLVTLDNQEARILVGTNIPLKTGSIANTTSTTSAYNTYDRKDVGIMLNVRPQISQGGTIKLQIYQEDSSVDPTTATADAGYTINKRSLQSTVLVDNGQIIVLGGLIRDSYTNGNSKVPWLGNIPVLGSLFRAENKTRTKTDLMVFLRPVIIRDSDTSREVSLDRYDYMRAQSANYRSDNRLILDRNVPMPPPIESPTDPNNTVRVPGLMDWNHSTRSASGPYVSPNVLDQPPYQPDPALIPGAGAAGNGTQGRANSASGKRPPPVETDQGARP
ncbi:type II secretion system secretin GspD [Robbsia sp. Bb-Pol-6]|uniref:Type II secretion system secretin GspD n=1 Tax=Robbsia betulipollinis TaxID=2981849 RepID=A0ABT3ZRJ3_9BURK|nr:type II secretion system secretin GspD [Robbsia betulipollinis]MCY0389181.1 type II secretion system secretin GspD [Robbsia betulipollinis]